MIGVAAPPSKATQNPLDKFTEIAGWSLDGQELTINKDWGWTIGDVNNTNPDPVLFEIDYAAPGLKRTEIIGAVANNSFIRLVGKESTIGTSPTIPPNFLTVTSYTVTDDEIILSEPELGNHSHSMSQVNGLRDYLDELSNHLDNKVTPIYITVNPTLRNTGLNSLIIAAINDLPTFIVAPNDIPVFIVTQTDGITLSARRLVSQWMMANLGAGKYGQEGTQLESNNDVIQITPASAPTLNTLPPNAAIIEIEESGDVWTLLNEKIVPVTIASPSVTPTVIITNDASYLWIGAAGAYGADESQSTEADFQVLEYDAQYATVADIIKYVGSTTVRITEWSQIANKVLDPYKIYIIEGNIVKKAGESIIIPSSKVTIKGYSFTVSSIFSSVPGEAIFTSPDGGSGDFVLAELAITTVGAGSKVFDLTDSDGSHAVEFEYVNFEGCKSIGEINGYRQGTATTCGFFGCADGLTFSGQWNGFKVTNTNVFGFGSTGTLFKKGTDLTFSNRFFATLNVDFPTGSVLTDMVSENFLSNELLQINSSMIKVDGSSSNPLANALALIPNLSPNHLKCLWIGNIGLPDTATENLQEDNTVSGTHEINWLIDTHLLTMTGDTIFTESNLPANGKNTQEIKIYLTGEFEPTFPAGWTDNLVGTYKGADVNEISIKFVKTGLYFMKIANSLSVYPAPSLQTISPSSILPSSTSEVNIYGSFFTPATIVSIAGQTVNFIEFLNQGHLRLSVTTEATEGEYDLIISNGTSVVFTEKIIVNLGIVFIPQIDEWSDETGALETGVGFAKTEEYSVQGTAIWNKEFDHTKDFRVQFKSKFSALGRIPLYAYYQVKQFALMKVSDGNMAFAVNHWLDDTRPTYKESETWSIAEGNGNAHYTTPGDDTDFTFENTVVEFRYISGTMYIYIGNVLRHTFPDSVTENLKLRVLVRYLDNMDIKYIELPDE